MSGATPGGETGFGPVEGDGEISSDRGIGRLAARQVDCSRRVDRHDRDTGTLRAIDDLDRRPDRLPKRTADPRSEQGVHDDCRLLDALCEDGDVAGDGRVDLDDAGVACDPKAVRIEAREDRWAVFVPGDRMAWFPANPNGSERLALERKILRMLESR